MYVDSGKLQAYIDQYWHRPSDDHIVWLANDGLDVSWFIKNRLLKIKDKGLDPATDAVVFLMGSSGDDLCMIEAAYQDKIFTQMDCDSQNVKYCVLWEWVGPVDSDEGGLNDCTVFVTHALNNAGLTYLGALSKGKWAIRGPDVLLTLLKTKPPSEVKILASSAAQGQIQEVLKAASEHGIVSAGDLLFLREFDVPTYHHTLLLTPAGTTMPYVDVCCHTAMNHGPLANGLWDGRSWDGYFSGSRSNYGTLIHFAYSDPIPQAVNVTKTFKVIWKRPPAATTFTLTLNPNGTCGLASISRPKIKNQTGFWFDVTASSGSHDIVMFWTQMAQPMHLTITGDSVTGATSDGTVETVTP